MDSQGFRLPQPWDNPYHKTQSQIRQETDREIQATKTVPAPNNRYPAYAAQMDDGRLVTDYRPSCVSRAPPGAQFGVKQWTVHNAEQIMEISRQRQAESTGHVLGVASTEAPFMEVQQCSTDACTMLPTQTPGGIGLTRQEPVPDLFGTFTYEPTINALRANHNKLDLNKEVLYGRNTSSRWTHLYA